MVVSNAGAYTFPHFLDFQRPSLLSPVGAVQPRWKPVWAALGVGVW